MTVHDKLMTDLGQVVQEKSQKIGARRCKHVDHVSTSQAIAWRKWNCLKMTSSWIDSTSAAAVATVASNSASCAASKWHAWRCHKLELLFNAESCRFTMFNNVQLSVACSYAKRCNHVYHAVPTEWKHHQKLSRMSCRLSAVTQFPQFQAPLAVSSACLFASALAASAAFWAYQLLQLSTVFNGRVSTAMRAQISKSQVSPEQHQLGPVLEIWLFSPETNWKQVNSTWYGRCGLAKHWQSMATKLKQRCLRTAQARNIIIHHFATHELREHGPKSYESDRLAIGVRWDSRQCLPENFGFKLRSLALSEVVRQKTWIADI